MLKYWDLMNQNELKNISKNDIVSLVVSSLEQHAYHLPTGTDRLIGEAISNEVAKKSKYVFIALPSVGYGFSAHHMDFPGSITLCQTNLINMIVDIVSSLETRGVKNVIVFNSHGGNTPSLKVAVNNLAEKYSGNLYLIEYWDFLRPHIQQVRKSPLGGIGHAGEMETSLMMYLYPNLVQLPASNPYSIAPSYKGVNPDMFANNKIYMFRNFKSISPHGNVGIPDFSDAMMGKQLFHLVSDDIVTFIESQIMES